MSRIVLLLLLLVSVPGVQTTLASQTDNPAIVAAASSLRLIWPALIEQYVADTHRPAPRTSFASSGLLSTQIINGAPFELFLSADREHAARIPSHKLPNPTHVFASGTLVLMSNHHGRLANSGQAKELSLSSLKQWLQPDNAGTTVRIAIPNPVHAPYGRAAQEALIWAEIWPLKPAQLLAAENASQTLQFLMTSAVDFAIVPQILVSAISPALSPDIQVVALPDDSYRLVEHHLATMHNAGEQAQAFAQWMLSKKPQHILQNAGLQLPTP